MLRKYGSEHALQNRELHNKALSSAYLMKNVQLGDRTVEVQGYEPQALEWIQSVKGVEPSQILCGSEVPSISYTFKGSQHVYHPDIFIPHLNRIVEVKSAYTFSQNISQNKAKRKACKKQGFKFSFLVMEKSGEGNVCKY